MICLKARCDAVVAHNGIMKVLLTMDSAPESQDEHLLLNLLKSRGELERDKTYKITIEEEGPEQP
jgi:hypothetical protein